MAAILIVEDDAQIRVLAQSILEDGGHAISDAAGIESAKALLDGEQSFDLLFTDIELGSDSEGGVVIAQYAREKYPDIKVIYTTGQNLSEGLRAAFVDGSQFLAKPYTPEQLLAAVAALS